jgi:transcriptional antiterminator
MAQITFKKNMDRRRSRILYYILLGYSASEIVGLVTESFGCSERTVKRDIKGMDQWIGKFLPLEDDEMEAYNRVMEECRNLFYVLNKIIDNSKNDSATLYALKIKLKIRYGLIKLLEIIGAVEQHRLHQEAIRNMSSQRSF